MYLEFSHTLVDQYYATTIFGVVSIFCLSLPMLVSISAVVAIELLAACQGLEFHRPKKTTAPLEEVYKLVRSSVRWELCEIARGLRGGVF